MKPIVTANWLHQNLQDPELVILDASQSVYKAGGTTNHENIQIIGARHFDLKNDFSNPNSEFPNTFPSADQFTKSSQKLGINQGSKIVVYDNVGVYTSPRAWWMFKTMGHDNIYVLDGGLPEWIQNGYQTEENIDRKFEKGTFEAQPDLTVVKTIDRVVQNTTSRESILIDARSKGRFAGTAPEPREGLQSGHIPCSLNLPFDHVLDEGKFKSKEELIKIFDQLRIDDRELIFSCGSGVTACINLLAAELALPNQKSVYDGSWTEWAQSYQLIVSKNSKN